MYIRDIKAWNKNIMALEKQRDDLTDAHLTHEEYLGENFVNMCLNISNMCPKVLQ